MDALYAFTDCEISISPNACVIVEDKPQFMSVNDILKYNTQQTVKLLKQELEIRKAELKEKILFSSLEKIFIENRIYRDIEECESWEEVISTIDKGLKPHKKKFYREITTDDIVRLTEIKIKRISRYDSFKADELLKDLEKQLKETEHHLKHLTDYAISYYQNLLDKYGKGRERKTEIKSFQSVTATEVIAINQKLYVNRTDGFVGYGLKRDEFVCDCSELDDIIAIRKDGKALVSRVSEKVFMGKDILYVGVWKKGDDRMVYNLIYSDGKSGKGFVKRFTMPGVIRDKEYDLTQGHPNSKIHYVTGNPNGEAEIVEVKLSQSSTARKKIFEFDFADLEVKGRGARGNILTKYPIRKVDFLQAGTSTLGKLNLWYDADAGRLNKDERGKYLGKFSGEDQLITFLRNGSYRITGYDITTRFDPEKTLAVEKFNPKKVISAVYIDGESKQHMVKRFLIETSTVDKEFGFISETIGSRLVLVTTSDTPEIELELSKGKDKKKVTEVVNLEDVVDVKGWKALGNRLSQFKIIKVHLPDEPEDQTPDEADDTEATETGKGIESPKKKEGEFNEQPSLFEEPKKQSQEDNPSSKKAKQKVEQASLFETAKPSEKSSQNQSEKSEQKKVIKKKSDKPDDSQGGQAFGVGETIELEL
jgi:topoisomerase-4 subunit A